MACAAAPASSPVLFSFGSRYVVRRNVYWKLRVLTHRTAEDCPLFAHIDRPNASERLLVSHRMHQGRGVKCDLAPRAKLGVGKSRQSTWDCSACPQTPLITRTPALFSRRYAASATPQRGYRGVALPAKPRYLRFCVDMRTSGPQAGRRALDTSRRDHERHVANTLALRTAHHDGSTTTTDNAQIKLSSRRDLNKYLIRKALKSGSSPPGGNGSPARGGRKKKTGSVTPKEKDFSQLAVARVAVPGSPRGKVALQTRRPQNLKRQLGFEFQKSGYVTNFSPARRDGEKKNRGLMSSRGRGIASFHRRQASRPARGTLTTWCMGDRSNIEGCWRGAVAEY